MWVCVRRVQKFIWLWFIIECLVSNYCDWDRYWLLYCVLQTERDWHNGSPDTLHCLRFLRHRCNWCSRGNEITIWKQNWNPLSHPNGTLAPQARLVKVSGKNLNYMTISPQVRPYGEICHYSLSRWLWYPKVRSLSRVKQTQQQLQIQLRFSLVQQILMDC